jgi:hypothetical protein
MLIGALCGVALVAATLVTRIAGRRAHRARLALEPAAPAPPVPATPRRRAARERALAAVRSGGGAARTRAVEAEVEHDGERFRLRGLGPDAGSALDGPASAPVAATAVAARTDAASRAHALLCDRLVAHGWEPCGRGPGWYAHRYRRS